MVSDYLGLAVVFEGSAVRFKHMQTKCHFHPIYICLYVYMRTFITFGPLVHTISVCKRLCMTNERYTLASILNEARCTMVYDKLATVKYHCHKYSPGRWGSFKHQDDGLRIVHKLRSCDEQTW